MNWIVIFVKICLWLIMLVDSRDEGDSGTKLECYRRLYNHTVVNSDPNGRTCWDTIPVLSCWGRCDSHEISDWKFPYKKSHHPVCLHETRELVNIALKNCEENVQPGTEKYYFTRALTCKCSACESSETSCENLLYKEEDFYPMNEFY